MVTEPERLKADFAAPILLDQWKKRLHPDVADELELLERNARRHLALLQSGRAEWLDRVEAVVHNARQALRARDAEYRSLIGDAAHKFKPFTIREALRGKVQTAIVARNTVPGIYTRTGWSKHARGRLAKKAVSGASVEPWVLGEDQDVDVGKRLRNRYFEQYKAAWLRFMQGLSLRPAADARESLLLLQALTDPPSLYEWLFQSIAHNTRLPLVDAVDSPAAKRVGNRLAYKAMRGSKLGRVMREARYMGLDEAAMKRLQEKPSTPVGKYYLPLYEFVTPTEGHDSRPRLPGLQQYVEQLAKVRSALNGEMRGLGMSGAADIRTTIEETRRVTKGILAMLPGSIRRAVQDLFYQPLEITSTTARAAVAGRSAERFSNELCAAFQEKLAGRYPFARSSRGTLMQDVIEFFAPNGHVWSYYERNLRDRLPRRGDKFVPVDEEAVPKSVVSFVNRAWQVTRALFPFGTEVPRLRFEVRVKPAVLSAGSEHQVSEIVLEVDGKARSYRNGPSEVWQMVWRGQGERSRLLVRGAKGLREEISFEGDWSLLRLIDRAKKKGRGSWVRVEWRFRNGQITIPMEFRPSRTRNPLFERLTLDCK
jgi:type VI secretion system protein ImpL